MGAGVGASPGTLRKKATGLADKGAGGGGGGRGFQTSGIMERPFKGIENPKREENGSGAGRNLELFARERTTISLDTGTQKQNKTNSSSLIRDILDLRTLRLIEGPVIKSKFDISEKLFKDKQPRLHAAWDLRLILQA